MLADLNCVSPGEIRAVLAEAGVTGIVPPQRMRARTPRGRAAEGSAAPPDQPDRTPAVYGQIETILAALPADASEPVRRSAADLLCGMFEEYLEDRLRLAERGAAAL